MDIKPAVSHDDQAVKPDPGNSLLLKSQEDALTPFQTALRFRKAVLVCTLICIAAAADGYQINLSGNIIANSGFIRRVGYQSAEGKWQLHPNYTALWGALQSLGQLIAMIGLTPISDRIGRKMTLYVLWVILLASILIESFTRNWRDWAGAKLLAGVGVGALQSTLPIYIAEWSPVNIRGSMTTAYSIWNNIGNFLAPAILYAMQKNRPNEWKIPVYTQYAFLGIMLPIFIWLPETPSYYASKGQDEKGIATLRRVNGNVPGYDVIAEYQIYKNTVMEEKQLLADLGVDEGGWRQLGRSYLECLNRRNFRRTLGAALPAVLQQLTGLAFLSVYSSLFFREAGFSNAFQITSILAGIKIGCVIVYAGTTDHIGRRNVVLGLGTGCTLFLFIIGILGVLKNKTEAVKNTLIAMACLWSACNVGLGALGWTYAGEVPAQKLRARATGIAAAMAVVFGLTFNTAVPVMLQTNGANLGYNTAWLFFGTGLVALVLSFLYVPETARRNPAELDELYDKGVAAWKMQKFVTDVQVNNMAGHRVEAPRTA